MTTILDRYLAKRLIATLLKTLLSLVLLYVLIDFLTARQDNIGRYDVPIPIVFEYYVVHVPAFLFRFQALALALLVSTLLVLGRCAQDNEITAFLAGGVSLGRIVRVPVLIALLLAIGVFAYENTIGPELARRAAVIDREYFSRFASDAGGGRSWTNLGDRDWTCHILTFNNEALTGRDVFIHAFTETGMEAIGVDRIYWDPARASWILEDGHWISEHRDTSAPQGAGVTRSVQRITQRAAPFDENPEMLFALDRPAETKSVAELYRDLEHAEVMGLPAAKSWVAFHTKFSRPALCFVIIWLAIPFALKIRRGGLFISFGASIALGLAYVMLFVVSVGLGTLGLIAPLPAAWFATLVFMATGAALFQRARVQ